MRLIDADALGIGKAKREVFDNPEYADGWNSAIDLINNAPTIDAVPVVRCKDCKWYGRADKRRFYRGTDCLNHRIDTIVPNKDYCSRAERRTDEQTN